MKSAQIDEHKYSIGEAARLVDVSTDTLRHYEKKGLLPDIPKTASGYRKFSDSDIRRICFIKKAQARTLSLSEIKRILDMKETNLQSCKPVQNVLINRKNIIEKKLIGLTSASEGLDDWIKSCDLEGDLPVENCPLLKSLDEN